MSVPCPKCGAKWSHVHGCPVERDFDPPSNRSLRVEVTLPTDPKDPWSC